MIVKNSDNAPIFHLEPLVLQWVAPQRNMKEKWVAQN